VREGQSEKIKNDNDSDADLAKFARQGFSGEGGDGRHLSPLSNAGQDLGAEPGTTSTDEAGALTGGSAGAEDGGAGADASLSAAATTLPRPTVPQQQSSTPDNLNPQPQATTILFSRILASGRTTKPEKAVQCEQARIAQCEDGWYQFTGSSGDFLV
jgi:hypothetical protein